jgi:RNA polymerase sigma-70 factor (ECF subfamily)
MALHHLRDGDVAAEVAQECLQRVVASLAEGKLRDPARLGAFTRAIAHHVIVDVIRSRRRAPAGETDLARVPAPVEDQLLTLIAEEERDRVRAALATLSPLDREILRASFYEGLSPQDLAARLGEPGPRIRKRKERALARLRDALQAASGHNGRTVPTPTVPTSTATVSPTGTPRP